MGMPDMSNDVTSRRELILGTVDDLAINFVYYDRKEDEELPTGSVEEALAAGEVTLDELTARFRAGVEKHAGSA